MAQSRRKIILCICNDPLPLNRRCGFLKDDGWDPLCEVSSHEGVLLTMREPVDAVVLALNDDGAEAALIAGELKRLHPKLPIIMIVPDVPTWVPEATAQADEIVVQSNEREALPSALRRLLGVSRRSDVATQRPAPRG